MEILLLFLVCAISGAAIASVRRGFSSGASRRIGHSGRDRARHKQDKPFESRASGLWGAFGGLLGGVALFQADDHADDFKSPDVFDSSHESQSMAGAADEGHFLDDAIEHQINPANGLPMVGAVDVAGNPYGTDSSLWDDTLSAFSGDGHDHFNHDCGGMDDPFHSDF